MTTAARPHWTLTALGTLVVVVAGVLLWQRLPANTDTFAPFDVHGAAGQRVTGRGLSGTVDAVTITPKLVDPFGHRLTAVGTWVVVDTVLEAGNDYGTAHADLMVGPDQYLPTERVLNTAILQPGITDRRSWVFDVAPPALAEAGSVVFRVWVGDGRLDSRLVIEIPLTDPQVRHTGTLVLSAPVQAAR